jgi:hypothetical protein
VRGIGYHLPLLVPQFLHVDFAAAKMFDVQPLSSESVYQLLMERIEGLVMHLSQEGYSVVPLSDLELWD